MTQIWTTLPNPVSRNGMTNICHLFKMELSIHPKLTSSLISFPWTTQHERMNEAMTAWWRGSNIFVVINYYFIRPLPVAACWPRPVVIDEGLQRKSELWLYFGWKFLKKNVKKQKWFLKRVFFLKSSNVFNFQLILWRIFPTITQIQTQFSKVKYKFSFNFVTLPSPAVPGANKQLLVTTKKNVLFFHVELPLSNVISHVGLEGDDFPTNPPL